MKTQETDSKKVLGRFQPGSVAGQLALALQKRPIKESELDKFAKAKGRKKVQNMKYRLFIVGKVFQEEKIGRIEKKDNKYMLVKGAGKAKVGSQGKKKKAA